MPERMTLPPYAEALGDGLVCIDTGFERERFDAAYLLIDNGHAAFIDTGTNYAVPRLLATLDTLGLPREAVDYVIPTHVHLDHAGGAGALMRELPRAQMLVHPRGLRHMVDPSALHAGALAVYGEAAMASNYGTLVAVDAQRASATTDGMEVTLGTRRLAFAHTPGHAQHHHCVWDATSEGWFTGDTFGISYREFDTDRGPWILASSTPVQFDPVVLADSVRRLLQRRPSCMYLTHYGRVGDVERLGADLLRMLQQMVDIGRRHHGADERELRLREALLDLYQGGLRAHGCARDDSEALLAVDLRLNAQGLGIWLDRLAERTQGA